MKLINTKDEFSLEINELNYLLDNNDLIEALTKPNYENEESSFSFVINEEEPVAIYDNIQVKINIKDVGEFLIYFRKDQFDKETRKQLLDNLSSLKDIDVKEEGNLSKKINAVYDFLKDVPLYFGVFTIQYRFDEMMEILNNVNQFFTTIVIKDEKVIEEKEEEIKEEIKEENKQEEPQEESTIEEDKKEKPHKENPFPPVFNKAKKELSKHIINLVYSLLLAMVAGFSSVFFLENDVGYGILFVVFIIAFVGLLSYDFYELKESYKEYHPLDYVLLALETALAFSVGIALSALLIKNLLKFDKPVDYPKLILITSIIVIGVSLLIHLITFLLVKFLPKILLKFKNRKEKKED